ncbi:MAG TPA: TRAP transporter permease [Syntrophorhabdaceae bacterium]|nr:TRAP transporter permease [Syntrophorhabdaceae bacterium]HNT67882.1 TRAP transporter permease [Syntrophorhabdaceae bacterium]
MKEKTVDLGKIKDAELIRTREFGKFGSWVIYIVGALCSLFHLYCLLINPIDPWFFRGMHIVFLSFLCFLLYPGWQGASKKVHFVDYILILMIIVPFVYMVINFDEWIYRVGVLPTTWDSVVSLIFIIAILEMTRRTTGLALAIIATVFILYGYFGSSLPGLFYHKGYSWPRIFTYLFSLDGILGLPIFVSAAYVYIFVIFGAFLRSSGVGAYFIQFANAIVGWARGGPAKVAIISSSLFGTVSGSSAANVVGTGSFTIPMMKSMGYKSHFAGAVEAVASTGGQIMPPVMGAGAFLMAEILGVPYVKVLVAAILPAAMYYLAVYFMVDFEAAKTGLVGLPPDRIPNKKETLKKLYMFTPLAVLVYYIAVAMASIIKAGTMAVITCIAVSWTSRETRMGLKKVIDALANGAKGAIEMAGTCAAAGIVIGIISQTGIGLKFATILLEYSKGILPFALFLSMIVAIVLGMGMPTTAAYAICAAVITTGLIKLGAIPIAAHLFVFYFACISAITPPVALAAYAGAAIANASPNRVGFTAMKLGIAAFIAPYMFIFNPAMLLIGSLTDVIIVTATALLGTFALACGMQGWLLGRIVGLPIRILLIAGAIMLIKPGVYTDIAGACLLVITYFLSRFFSKKQAVVEPS